MFACRGVRERDRGAREGRGTRETEVFEFFLEKHKGQISSMWRGAQGRVEKYNEEGQKDV